MTDITSDILRLAAGAHQPCLNAFEAETLRKWLIEQANAMKVKQHHNANIGYGHGHVFHRPDGVRARCGGPGICAECSRDKMLKDGLMVKAHE